jgi:hypothetical protein
MLPIPDVCPVINSLQFEAFPGEYSSEKKSVSQKRLA